eukprot:377610-Rhodomonas_salina.1
MVSLASAALADIEAASASVPAEVPPPVSRLPEQLAAAGAVASGGVCSSCLRRAAPSEALAGCNQYVDHGPAWGAESPGRQTVLRTCRAPRFSRAESRRNHPASQLPHPGCPDAVWNLPDSHALHSPDPASSLQVPATHATHGPASGPVKPSAHTLQSAADSLPAAELSVAGHAAHPPSDRWIPAAHLHLHPGPQ